MLERFSALEYFVLWVGRIANLWAATIH